MRLAFLAMIALTGTASAADRAIELNSAHTPMLGLPLPESEKAVYRISITKVNEKGEGTESCCGRDRARVRRTQVLAPSPQSAGEVRLHSRRKGSDRQSLPARRLGAPEPKEPPKEVKWAANHGGEDPKAACSCR